MTPTFPVFDVAEMAEEAAERAGIEFRSGYALRSARRSIELLSIDWGNRGLNLWTVEQGSVLLVPGTAEYSTPDDTIDLIEHNLRWTDLSALQTHDMPLPRRSISEFMAIPAKRFQGRPTTIYIKRAIHPSFILWPVPPADGIQYTVVYSRLRRMASVGPLGGTHEPEIPFRFVPAMIAGLALYMAMKSDNPAALQRIPMLKAAYDEAFGLAADEDRDRASVRWVPWGYQT